MAEQEIIARIGVSAGRRVFGIAVLAVLAVAMLWLGLRPEATVFTLRLLMIVLGVLVGLAAWAMARATGRALELTPEVLRDSSGHVLAHVAEIESVDRGAFAFKPSNGFLLKLARPGGRRFLPGLYWQVGRRVGVGGVLRASETKLVADRLSILLAERGAK
ncbi:hypothetical protein KM176_04190 [Pseudooceanicola sp. CBS1P-1]|uniref:Uncharacterized protein n=1 Tax=Pseudooceanicola albus TaxID=2692189 RepID=A0A6L7G5Q8_9RHOB|nr:MULTISPECIES: hypothetical protein [Pseudooceanicola]MBT9383051.1 hypothetical protein [Pseudooceanicola endophyticus]MXN19239.1 hypothetical protein [Pseudooceanicola albus]